jgi:hypothetical protein
MEEKISRYLQHIPLGQLRILLKEVELFANYRLVQEVPRELWRSIFLFSLPSGVFGVVCLFSLTDRLRNKCEVHE